MPNYMRVILGKKNANAEEFRKNGFIGCSFEVDQDLSKDLAGVRKKFSKKYISAYRKKFPDKNKLAAGLACGSLWTIGADLQIGDIVLSPNGNGSYFVGEVIGPYIYDSSSPLPHKRPVLWKNELLDKAKMSQPLQNCAGSIGTTANLNKYASELEQLLSGRVQKLSSLSDESIEDPHEFSLETHLENFLIHNWKQTKLGEAYDILEIDGKTERSQFPTSTGPIDILAISKDKKSILVVELKKGRANDRVIGQIQRYMGCVQSEFAEEGQDVKGLIIAHSEDAGLIHALKVTKNIEFMKYQVQFLLSPVATL